MRNIWTVFKTDIRSLSKCFFACVVVVAIALLPSLYAWLNIYSNWDPYGNTGGISIAVASLDEGYTDVIHVPINKSGSSTYNNALMAQGMLREERPEHHLKIHLLDPHTYSMVFGWYLCEMARKLKNGAEISHVIREFEKQMDCMEIVLGPYSLKQMKKSGRISAAAAVMGELMGIRPIITLIDGKTKVEAKVRGDDKVVPAMVELCKQRSEGVENFDYMIGHTNIPQTADLEKACRKAFGKPPLLVFELGGVVSANTGPDTVALVYTGHPRG